MTSPFINLFMAIRQQVLSNVKAIVHFDQDLAQLSSQANTKINTRPPVNFPCVLLDFEDFSFNNLSENVQMVNGTIVLKLGFAAYSNSAQDTPKPNLAQAFSYYDIEFALQQVLHGWSPGEDFGHLCRKSVTTQKRNDNYRVREIRYSISFEDYSTKITTKNQSVTVVLTDEIV